MNSQSLALTPNESTHLRSWISFRVRISLSDFNLLTHVPTDPTLKLNLKSYAINRLVDIRIGTVGWSCGGNMMLLSHYDKPAGQYHSQ